MKNNFKIFLCTLVLIAFMPITQILADDEAKESISIAVVDIQKLMADSKAANSIRNQGVKIRNEYKKRIKTIEKELASLDKKLLDVAKDKDSSADEIKKQRDKFQERLIKGQKETAELNVKLDNSLKEALGKLSKEIIEITEDIADDDGYSLIVSKSNVIYVGPQHDITDKVMTRLNKSLRSVSVKK